MLYTCAIDTAVAAFSFVEIGNCLVCGIDLETTNEMKENPV